MFLVTESINIFGCCTGIRIVSSMIKFKTSLASDYVEMILYPV